MKSVGAQLREARQARGWTPKAAAKATKIKEQQLLFIENEEYNKFAAPAYVRGFVRIYSKTLGLNETKILLELDKVLAAEGDDVYLSSSPVQYLPGSERKTLSPRGLLFFFALAVLGAMVMIMAVHVYQVLPHHAAAAQAKPKNPADEIPVAPAVSADAVPVAKAVAVDPTPEPVAKAVAVAPPASDDTANAPVAKAVPVDPAVQTAPVPVATPVQPAGAAPATPATAGDNLIVQASADCWVRVLIIDKDQSSRELFSGTMRAGDQKEFSGDKFQLKIAIPSAISVTFNGNVYHSDTQIPGEFSLPPQ